MSSKCIALEAKSVEYRLKEIESIAHIGTWTLDLQTGVSVWSEEACRIYGLDGRDTIQSHQSWLSFIHPEDLNYVKRVTQKVKELHEETAFYYRILHRDGTLKHIYTQTRIELNREGLPIRAYGVIHDVTEQKVAEGKRVFDSANLTSLINNTNDLMWSVDTNFNLITSNDAFTKLVRMVSGDPIETGSNMLATAFSKEKVERYRKYYERAFAGETFTEIEGNETPFVFWTETSFYPIHENGKIIGTACHSRDITENKKMWMQSARLTANLIQQNKDLEQFAYMVSHNLRAPLANIMGLCDVLNCPDLTEQGKAEMLIDIVHSSKKLDSVVQDLNLILQIRNNTDGKKEYVSFPDVMNDIKGCFLSKSDSSHLSIKGDFKEVEGMLTIKPYLKSVFYNLISNSVKFKRAGVDTIIEVKSEREENNIVLVFKDNGMGIDLEKNGDKVFKMYNRFHGETEGKGMGLFLTRQQVETLGGKISVKSEVNRGIEFRIVFHNSGLKSN